MKIIISFSLLILFFLWPFRNGHAADEVNDSVEKPVMNAIEIRQNTQGSRTAWQNERQKFMEKYEQLQQAVHQLKDRKNGLSKIIASAGLRINEKERQLADIKQISDQINPFLGELSRRLREQVETDMPFLSIERKKRLEKLDQLIMDRETAINEKFRKLMEAVMVEAEYGQTIEVYQETVPLNNREMLVNVFRLGRIAIFYQTLDGKDCGFYNVAASTWDTLPEAYNHAIQTAMDIGAKRRPIELLSLPIGRMNVK